MNVSHACHVMIAFPCMQFYECCPMPVIPVNAIPCMSCYTISLSLSHTCHMNAFSCMSPGPMFADLCYACLFMNALPCMLPSSDWHLKDFFKSNWVMLLEIRILRRHVSKSANAASKRSEMLLPSQRWNLQASNT